MGPALAVKNRVTRSLKTRQLEFERASVEALAPRRCARSARTEIPIQEFGREGDRNEPNNPAKHGTAETRLKLSLALFFCTILLAPTLRFVLQAGSQSGSSQDSGISVAVYARPLTRSEVRVLLGVLFLK